MAEMSLEELAVALRPEFGVISIEEIPEGESTMLDDELERAFERALKSAKGVTIECGSAGMAVKTRQRLNNFRSRLKQNSKLIYEIGDGRYGKSAYDSLVLRINPDEPTKVRIVPYELPGPIEEI